MPTVSIIMPTYNQADFLKAAVASVLAQTVSDWELLIVDNRSTDGTADVVAAFGDERIKYMQIDNGGVIARSRNLALDHACGTYVAFLDSDDLWQPSKLATSLNLLQQGFDLVSHAIIPLQDGVEGAPYRWRECVVERVEDLLYGKMFVATSTVVATREVIERAGRFSEEPAKVTAEDFDFWLCILEQGARFKIFEDALTTYRIHAASASKASDLKHLHACLFVLREHHQNLGGTRRALAKREAHFYYLHGRRIFLSRAVDAAKPLLAHAVKLAPLNLKYWAAYAQCLCS